MFLSQTHATVSMVWCARHSVVVSHVKQVDSVGGHVEPLGRRIRAMNMSVSTKVAVRWTLALKSLCCLMLLFVEQAAASIRCEME